MMKNHYCIDVKYTVLLHPYSQLYSIFYETESYFGRMGRSIQYLSSGSVT